MSANEYLYTGRRLDPATGLQLNRNRFYASHLGRWVSKDPIGYLGSKWNLYQYVRSPPISKLDSHGLLSLEDIGQGIGIIAKKCVKRPFLDLVAPCVGHNNELEYAAYECVEECAPSLCGSDDAWGAARESQRIANQHFPHNSRENSALRHCLATALLARRCKNCDCGECVNDQRDWYQTNCSKSQGPRDQDRAESAGAAGAACAGCKNNHPAAAARLGFTSEEEIADCCLKKVQDGEIDLGKD